MIGTTNAICDNKNSNKDQLVNYTMLYDASFVDTELNQCEKVTGGWVSGQNLSNYSGGDFTLDSTGITCGDNSSGYGSKYISTNNKINIEDYTTILLNADAEFYGSNYTESTVINFPGDSFTPGGVLYFNSVYGGIGAKEYFVKAHDKTSTRLSETFVVTRNIDDVNRESHVVVYAYAGATGSQELIIKCKYLALFKQDDLTELSKILGIGTTLIDDFLVNSETLLSNKEAVEYMILNCTGDFMASAIMSETFLTALNNSPFKTKIMANDHWSKFLSIVA